MNRFKELRKSNLAVETPEGDLFGIVSNASRGSGREQNCITITLLTNTKPPSQGQCWVTFNGQRYGATFNNVMSSQKTFRSDLETIIGDKAFWE